MSKRIMKKFLDHPIIAAVLASIIFSALTGLASLLPSMQTTQDFLLKNRFVPTWIIAFFIVFLFLIILFSHLKKPKIIEVVREPAVEAATVEAENPKVDGLDDLQTSVLSMHSGLDPGYGIVPSEIAEELGVHIEVARHVHEKLQELGYTECAHYSAQNEPATIPTDFGREYIVQNNLFEAETHNNQIKDGPGKKRPAPY